MHLNLYIYILQIHCIYKQDHARTRYFTTASLRFHNYYKLFTATSVANKLLYYYLQLPYSNLLLLKLCPSKGPAQFLFLIEIVFAKLFFGHFLSVFFLSVFFGQFLFGGTGRRIPSPSEYCPEPEPV